MVTCRCVGNLLYIYYMLMIIIIISVNILLFIIMINIIIIIIITEKKKTWSNFVSYPPFAYAFIIVSTQNVA